MPDKKYNSRENPWYRRVDIYAPCLLVIISLCIAIAYILKASLNTSNMTTLETIMFQLFTLTAGVTASFIFGRQSAKQAAKELVKPHAKSAFRRLITLYKGLSRLAMAIEEGKQNQPSVKNSHLVLQKLEAMVIEQIATANDAIEDWRDIVPEDVEELIEKSSKVRDDNE